MRILAQSPSERAHPSTRRTPWVAAGVVTMLFGVVAAFGTVQEVPEPVFARTVVEPLALSARLDTTTAGQVFFREERFQRGDTISALLDAASICARISLLTLSISTTQVGI